MGKQDKLSIYLSYLLRHNPADAGIQSMDKHGWVDTEELIRGINETGKYKINWEVLQDIVATDSKGRYRLKDKGAKIKACQGHSIPWIEPELKYKEPPEYLYHGTTTEAWELIQEAGYISKMSRHAVHMQAEEEKAWKSALRWKKTPVVLKIDTKMMCLKGMKFGVSDNGVWCTEWVPVSCVCERIYVRK